MPTEITYETDITNVDWPQMKATLTQDNFDNGRTPQQLEKSFKNSYISVIAYASNRIIGTVRVLSDGVCNAYVVDVWTLSEYRNQGIASKMMETAEKHLEGQHVYLFTDDAMDFYHKLGYKESGVGMGKVVGQWLQNNKPQD